MGKMKAKGKPKSKKAAVVVEEKKEVLPPSTRSSDEPPPKQDKWVNKQRVLVFSTRGIGHRHRHLMEDLKRLMPHHKAESKMERTKNLCVVNEMCEMKNCNKAMMFEGRKKRDLYAWFSSVPHGPSAKFLVQNLYTMAELKFTGNCLTGTRPLLSFDESFAQLPHLTLLKQLLAQMLGVPKHHPRSQPFFDHVYSFSYLDGRIWFRNYQILTEDGALAEIGPRFVLNPVKIFSGSFGGTTLWENPDYVTPAKYRQSLTKKAAFRYESKIQQKAEYEASRPDTAYPDIDNQDIFRGDDLMEKATQELENDIKKDEQLEEEAKKENERPFKAKPKKVREQKRDVAPKQKFSIKRKQFKPKKHLSKKKNKSNK